MTTPASPGRPPGKTQGRGTVGIERRVLRDGVYDALLEILLENRVAPGEALAIDGLARELGVSPTPVREALVQLEHTGLVTRAALKGYRVAPPLSAERMRDLMTARSTIEVAGVRLAVPVAADVLAELESAHEQHEVAARRVVRSFARSARGAEWSVMRRYYGVDWEFHLILLRASGNHYLVEMAQSLAPHVHRLRQSMRQGSVDVEQAHAEHEVILDAVRAGDADRAAAAMALHLAEVSGRSRLDG